MAVIVNDTLTDTAGTALASHTGEVGATWTIHPAFSASNSITAADGARPNVAAGTPSAYYASGAAAGPDVAVSATVKLNGTLAGRVVAIHARQSSSAFTSYSIQLDYDSNVYTVYRWIAGAATSLGAIAAGTAFAAGQTRSMGLQVTGSGATVTLTPTTDGVQQTAILDTAAGRITAAGKAGVHWYDATTVSSGANGLFLDSITESDALPPATIPVADANWYFSPYNWFSDGAGAPAATNIRGASTFAQTTNPGAYFKLGFTGTSVAVNVDTAPLAAAGVPAGSWPTVCYSVDNGPLTTVQLSSAATQPVAAAGLTAGPHTLYVVFQRGDQTYDRWTTPANVLKVTSINVDSGGASAAPSGATAVRANNAVVFGDSMTEGIFIDSATVPGGGNALADYAAAVAAALNAEVGVIGYGGQGWTKAGQPNSNVAKFYDAGTPANSGWRNYFAGASRLVSGLLSPAPDWLIEVHGANDGLNSLDPATAVTAWLAAARAAAPAAKIAAVVPFGGFCRSQIVAGFGAYQTTPDANAKLIDLGTAFQVGLTAPGAATLKSADGLHPNAPTHAAAAADLAYLLHAAFNTGSAGISVARVFGGM